MNTGVTGFTRKTGVFFAYSVDGPEFPPALYDLRKRDGSEAMIPQLPTLVNR